VDALVLDLKHGILAPLSALKELDCTKERNIDLNFQDKVDEDLINSSIQDAAAAVADKQPFCNTPE